MNVRVTSGDFRAHHGARQPPHQPASQTCQLPYPLGGREAAIPPQSALCLVTTQEGDTHSCQRLCAFPFSLS